MSRPERILYVRTDRMGDVLMNLPALGALRQNFPKTWLTLAAERSVAPLFKYQPELDEVMEIDGPCGGTLSARWELLNKLRSIRYDMIIVSNPEKAWHRLAWAAGIPTRVGWRRKWPFLLNRTLVDDKASSGRHEIESNLKLVSLVAPRPWTGRPELRAGEASKKEAADLLGPLRTPAVALHTGTSDPAKRWPQSRFLELCQRLQENGVSIAFIGSAEETAGVARILSKLSKPCLDLTGKTTLPQLAGLFSLGRLRALVSSDSGPVHVAWLCGTPVLALYAKGTPGSNPDRWGPRDTKSRTIFKPMEEISSGEVASVLEGMLR